MRPKPVRRKFLILGAAVAGLLAWIGLWAFLPEEGDSMNTLQKTAHSADGTKIAYDQTGSGPTLIVVGAALSDRSTTKKLSKHLAQRFTVINYDRRGRGESTDTRPYAVEREIEDVDALIGGASGSAYIFGSSSGSVLALEAANRLGGKVKGLFLYEPPFIVDNSRPPMPPDFSDEVSKLVASGQRNEAVKLFFTKGMGIPPFIVTLMRLLMPGWRKMTAMAHTIPYDLALLAGTQDGKPLPAGRWATTEAPTMVMVGGRSEAFFHSGAKALVGLLPNAQYRSLQGRDHSAVMMASKELAAVVTGYFLP